jgi:dienelactone hydrolase
MEYKILDLRKIGSLLMGLSIMLAAHSALAAVTKTELAGNSISGYPYFEYVKAINVNDNVEIAIDPTRFPAIANQTCDIYVVAAKKTLQWDADKTLIDVTPGGMQTETFSNTNIQSNTFQVAAVNQLSANAGLGLGVGYDVVLDCNQDGLLNGDDYIDGRNNESGFYMVHDTTAPGPKAVTELTYNIAGSGIPPGYEGENLFFPTDVASVKAATGENLPLVIVSHGNGHWYEEYDHIGNHLASYGYVVMSHKNNTGPGPVSASTTTLAHTDALINQIAASAIAGAGALTGNIDTDRIVWIGHSRGAEGVAVAYDRMSDGTYTPTNFTMADIKLISSMLPTDFQAYYPLSGDAPSTSIADPGDANFHLWTASGDSDVGGYAWAPRVQTFHLHDRGTGNRQSTVVQGTGHGWFNNDPGDIHFTGPCPIGEANTHLVQLGHLLPLVKRYVDDNIPSIDFLTRQYESFRPIGVPTGNSCIQVSHEYLDASPNTASNPQKTVVIDDYQSEFTTGFSSSGEAVTFDVEHLTEDRLDDNNSDFTWIAYGDPAFDPFNGATQAGATDTSRGVVFDWTGSDKYYEWTIPVGERNFTDNLFLSLRGAQGTQHPNTLAVLDDLTFEVTLRDGQSTPVSSSISIGAFGGGFEQPYQRSGGWHNEMETIRIRLTDFLNNGSGLDLTDIVAVRLDVGPAHGSAEGRIVIDDLMLTNDRAVYDASDNGDPHVKTVNGINYDFHGAGEYTLLRDGADYEIQTRQTPVTTAGPLPNSYTGLSSCVAVNTALAARVGNHRISYQPDGSLDEQETRMRLRVDGVLQDIDALGSVNLGGGRVSKAASGNGIEVDFPNGSSLLVTPGWWSSHDIAYLNISVLNTPATEGIAGFIEPGQWLPGLSDGTCLGPKPADLSDRYKDLNETFSKSWRVSNASSLFDYAPGTSTATFTIEGWPFENDSSCELPNMLKVNPIDRDVAKRACLKVIDPDNRNNCIMDVAVTGEIGFAKTYLLAQKLEQAGTKTEIYPERKVTEEADSATFIAVIKRRLTAQRLIFDDKEQRYGIGRVQFYFNGEPIGEPVRIDRFGRAQWTSPKLKAGEYKVSAKFLPAKGDDDNFTSRSFELVHLVRGH